MLVNHITMQARPEGIELSTDRVVAARTHTDSEGAAKKALEQATKDWRAVKKRERDARDEVARIAVDEVKAGLVTENKAAKITDIPRMTIRTMLGKN